MLSVLIRIASNEKISPNICFLELSEEFRRDSKNEFELAMVNEPSVFELSRFNCTIIHAPALFVDKFLTSRLSLKS